MMILQVCPYSALIQSLDSLDFAFGLRASHRTTASTLIKHGWKSRKSPVSRWKLPMKMSQWDFPAMGLSLPGRRVSGKAPVPIFITHLGREVNLGCCEIFCHGRICLIVYNKNKHTHDSNMIIIPNYFLGVPKVATDICGILCVSHFQGQVVG